VPDRLAGQRDAAVQVEPMPFELGDEFAGGASYRRDEPGLPLELRVDLDEAIIGRALAVEQDLDDAEAGVDRLEQRTVAFLDGNRSFLFGARRTIVSRTGVGDRANALGAGMIPVLCAGCEG
jgi:hypothetical protein